MAAACSAFSQSLPADSAGFDLMTNKLTGNCMACHDLPGVSGKVSNFGPSLRGVGSKWTREELRQWVVDARKINADTLMPPFGSTAGLTKVRQSVNLLTHEQINAVVDTLLSWQ